MTSPDGSTVQAATASEPARAGRRHGPRRAAARGPYGHGDAAQPALCVAGPEDEGGVGDLARRRRCSCRCSTRSGHRLESTSPACGGRMLGIQMYNQFGQDYSAFWMVALTISSPRDAYVELRARALASLLIAVPYVTAVVVASPRLLGRLAGAARSAGPGPRAARRRCWRRGVFASARFPYSIPQDSGYKNVAPGQGCARLDLASSAAWSRRRCCARR